MIAIAAVLVSGCSLLEIDERDRSCPCGDGFVCCVDNNTCVESRADCAGEIIDPRPTDVVHAACNLAAEHWNPGFVRPLDLDANGRPLFDYWRDFDGSQYLDRTQCSISSTTGCASGETCVAVGGEPLCVPINGLDGRCDGGQSPILGADDHCVVCAPPQTRAAACSLGYDIDCRPWPYNATSGISEFCAYDDDCEIGLVCGGRPGGSGYGVCTCPDYDFGLEDPVCEET